ncbi:unnamed protein product [Symbiodinium necroappetens]|uniref:Uncharacterized protein n=1 Tax=Symbiodinium necroappetens TaxID=1628268 RepID=A0A812LMY3_9DINO|nr:unnamed protein product [Symbiodinium necroappetens]
MEDSADDETYDDHGSIAELEANVECDGDDDVDTDDDTGGKVSKLPHDSYSIYNYRYSSDKPDKLFEAPRAEFEELSADVDDAKERIAEKVLKKLKQLLSIEARVVLLLFPFLSQKDNQKLNLAGKGSTVLQVHPWLQSRGLGVLLHRYLNVTSVPQLLHC